MKGLQCMLGSREMRMISSTEGVHHSLHCKIQALLRQASLFLQPSSLTEETV